jgi:hypothetical protein
MKCSFGLAHGALQSEQETVVDGGWVIEAVFVADQRVVERTQPQQRMPVGVVAGQA